ncbi:MAG: M43 family zinc metalloprotease [Bacteroidia bacterium]
MEVYNQHLQDPAFVQRRQQIEDHTRDFTQFATQNDVQRVVYTIPVVFHVVYQNQTENISDAQLQSQLDVLNEDFRKLNANFSSTPTAFQGVASDMEFEFCLATIDPNGSATNGITRTQTTVSSFNTNDNVKFNSSGGKNAWPADDYLNIWVADLGSSLLGYAQFPGDAASTDGVVLHYTTVGRPPANPFNNNFNLGRTATHEIGHWMNLYHIWGNENSGCGNQAGSAGTDEVSDTPVQDDANYGCPNFPQVSCNNGPNGDMFMNYMDYMDDDCATMFTNGQKTRARAVFAPGGSRNSLLSSPACGSTPPPPPVNSCLDTLRYPLPGAEVVYFDATVGYVCGTNTYLDSAKAERFNAIAPFTRVLGGLFKFAIAEANGTNNYQVTFRLYDDNGTGGLPGSILASTTVPLSTISSNVNSNSYTSVLFSNPVTITGNFYLGYVVNPASGVELSLYSTENGTSGANTAYEQFSDGTWYSFETEPASWGLAITQSISAIMQSSNTPATPIINNSGGVLTVSNVSGTYQWFLNGNAISGATQSSYTPTAAGSYSVSVTSNGCSSLSSTLSISTVGITQLMQQSLQVFPNPAKDRLNISFSDPNIHEVQLRMVDLTGKVVVDQQYTALTSGVVIELGVDHLSSGMYQIILVHESGILTRKVCISKP